MTTKPSNPKDAIGSDKLPLHLWPATATAMGSVALLNGALKYGRSNWRHAGVRASIYYDALRRHMDRWFEGEEVDADDGVPHLAAALACLAILVDAKAAGKLHDDRQTPGGLAALMTELTPHVARLKALHAERAPQHFTIADQPVKTSSDMRSVRVVKEWSNLDPWYNDTVSIYAGEKYGVRGERTILGVRHLLLYGKSCAWPADCFEPVP
ncbi:dATP/dGTP diphosphohydrolase domain-containing protein [Roseomonas sp. USHLN139]|uniref:dATP/dGTP diphosphohydrolase domain-containing protein n=1 Tax=Roseomonas sp. USHLN139 TaxID=3081298 RepID=UPI003B016460